MTTAPHPGPARRLAPRARPFLREHRRALRTLGGWSLLESAQTFLGGYGVARALDSGFLAGRSAVGLAWLTLAVAAVAVGGLATRGVFRSLAELVEPLRDRLVRGVVKRSLREATEGVARTDSGAVSRLTHQTETARDSFAGLVLVARSFVFTAAGAVLGLASLDPLLLLVVLPPLLLGLALFAATLRPMAARQRELLAADEALAARVGALATGLRDVVACGAAERSATETARLVEAEARAARSLARLAAVRGLALGTAGHLPVLLLVALLPWLSRRGLTAGVLIGALTYLTQALLPALHSLMNGFGAAAARLLVVLDRLVPAEPAPAAGTGLRPSARVAPGPNGETGLRPRPREATAAVRAPRPPAPPAAELRRVTFAYGPGAEPVLRDLDLVVPPGEHLAVVGPSGIGKSTLTGLLAGLLEPDAGEVRVAGSPASGRPPHELARQRVLIPQQAYVFTGTVRDNLAYLCPEGAGRQALEASAHAVGLTPLVLRLGGLDATIDPAVLSQGERQLIALARAHLAPAPLVLLDEATCHLDPAAEARAEAAFAERPGTLVVVAHRITSALRASRILVLDGSRALCGRHEDLLDRSALYRDLVGQWEAAPAAPRDLATPSRRPARSGSRPPGSALPSSG